MKDELLNDERKAWARLLYTKHERSIAETALETGADEAAVRLWVQEGGWDGIKRSLLISRATQLEHLYSLTGALHLKMKNADEVSTKDVDLLIKYSAAIKNLEGDVTAAVIMEVAELFVKWLQRRDLELAKNTGLQFDAFIEERMSVLAA